MIYLLGDKEQNKTLKVHQDQTHRHREHGSRVKLESVPFVGVETGECLELFISLGILVIDQSLVTRKCILYCYDPEHSLDPEGDRQSVDP